MLATLLGLTTFFIAKSKGYPRSVRASWRERWVSLADCFWGLALVGIVMGGIYGGVFTPTEAAAVSAVYAFFIAVYVYKDLKLSDVPRVLLASASMSAMLLYIITNAVLFSFLLDARADSAGYRGLDRGSGFRAMVVPCRRQRALADRRVLHGAGIGDAHPGADPVSGGG